MEEGEARRRFSSPATDEKLLSIIPDRIGCCSKVRKEKIEKFGGRKEMFSFIIKMFELVSSWRRKNLGLPRLRMPIVAKPTQKRDAIENSGKVSE